MAKCEMCGKGRQFGHSVSHSMHATNRSWKPNIQKVTTMVDGKPTKLKVCTRCMRTLIKKAKV